MLFTLIAERYERRSLGITSNLVFSQWEHIFANPMATAAAIDRVVHHSVILEFDVPSYRTGVAQQRGQKKEVQGIRVESVPPCLRARPGGLLEREDVRAVEMQSQDGGGSGWIARKQPRSVPAPP